MLLFSQARRRERAAADRLYAACAAAARRPAMFTAFGVPDTLQGRFEMLTLHLFPVLHRLMHEPGDDPELARLVSESFVLDMDSAFREMGVGDVTVPKRMAALYRSFAGRITAYETALGSSDAALGAAVARNVFPEGGDPVRVHALAAYLMDAVAAMRGADADALRAGDTLFPPPHPMSADRAGLDTASDGSLP